MLARWLRLLFRRIIYYLVILGRALRPRLGWVITTIVLVGLIGFQTLLLILPRITTPPTDPRIASLAPSEAVEMFLEGQATYNADMMWESFSPLLQEALINQGGSKEALAERTESERQAGQRYRSFDYVGGVSLQNNQRRYFYVVDISAPTPDRTGLFSFIFTVDRDGKILSVKMDS